ncbi:hypothetical protein FNV43_RR13607 [Rhamnella rubrinervis]|uniref:Uncharacterized protein n=1 Tax=Rhamnella rubrinervis TaxID=2594499 RepID=A0A8K0MFF8_9ROSA|nr:hypothetical protein FNV43_RR13607 [Rhamnella rubrinervis]
MFSSSTNSLNPFPQHYSSSSSSNYHHHHHHHHHPPLPPPSSLPPIVNQDDDVLFHHHEPLISSPFLLNIAQIPETSVINLGVSNAAAGAGTTTMTNKQDLSCFYGHDDHHHGVPNLLANNYKKPMKKDRHSKIYTAQGLRDRRVRLSIEIAREFFDLQDMLGFDKASKTLEWLLTKSKKAIKDLARTKLSAAKSSSLTTTASECEEEDGSEVNEVVADHDAAINSKLLMLGVSKGKSTKLKLINESALLNLRSAKESRAKARARARERTREKMCNKRVVINDESSKKCPTNSQILNQLRTTMNHHHHHHQLEDQRSLKIAAQIDHENGPLRLPNHIQPSRGNIFQESILIKRKLMKQQSTYNHQQNSTSTNDNNSSNNNNDNSSSINDDDNNNNMIICPNLPQNWDMNSALNITTRPNFCAITNMNLSTANLEK